MLKDSRLRSENSDDVHFFNLVENRAVQLDEPVEIRAMFGPSEEGILRNVC